MGLNNDHFTSRAMNAGTYYEHAILEHLGVPRCDHQIILPEILLRVNLDGDDLGKIFEVKTHSAEKVFKVSKGYWQQVQVQSFAKLTVEKIVPQSKIVSYALTEDDYRDFFNPIDPKRIGDHPIEYDPKFIESYLRRLEYLCGCLRKGVFPNEVPD